MDRDVEELFAYSRQYYNAQKFLQVPEIIKSEAESALQAVSKRKATGIDDTSTDAFKQGENLMSKYLHNCAIICTAWPR